MASVLLAHPDASLRAVIGRDLERAGHRVVGAAAGDEALALWERQSPAAYDLLVSAVVMPGLDGLDLCQRVRDADPDAAVIWVTGFAAVEVSTGAEHAASFLSRPFHLRQIGERVAAHEAARGRTA